MDNSNKYNSSEIISKKNLSILSNVKSSFQSLSLTESINCFGVLRYSTKKYDWLNSKNMIQF